MGVIFLSYAREDRNAAERLARTLGEYGWSLWWDRELDAGEVWDEAIERRLEEADVALVLWSQASVRSRWVKNEARFADARGKLVPILIEPVTIPLEFSHVHAEDLCDWQEQGRHESFERLVETLKERLGAPTPPTTPESALSASPATSTLSPSPPRSPSKPAFWRRPLVLGLSVIAAVAVGALAVWLGQPGDNAPPSGTVADGNRLVVSVADGKTIAEWTPGCAFEVQTERRADGKLWACYTFDPGECFVARLADDERSKKPPTVGQPVFVSLTAARDRWAAGTVKSADGERFYVEVRSGLQCTKAEKPALWANVENIVAAPQ